MTFEFEPTSREARSSPHRGSPAGKSHAFEIAVEPGRLTLASERAGPPATVFVWTVYRREGGDLTPVLRGLANSSGAAFREASRGALDLARRVAGGVARG